MPCTLPYRKFPGGLKQPIRLLTLHPGKCDQPVVFSLKEHSLTSCPPYEALSYIWGSVDHLVVIKSDGGEIFHARRNLANALVRLRYPDKTRALWTDAICINQEDDDEKGKQVANMHNIYRQASLVIVWLGEAGNASDKAFKWIADEPKRARHFYDEFLRVHRAHPDFLQRVQRGEGAAPGVEQLILSMRRLATLEEVVKPMVALLDREYYTRVWVIQEIFFAGHIQVQCGADSSDWDTFVAACNTFRHSQAGRPYYSRPGFGGLAKLARAPGLKKVTEGRVGRRLCAAEL
jgi:hypothetical protein